MAHTAYLLACAGMNFYAGYTPDITRRVLLHETGRGAKYTRAHRPVRLVYTEEYATKSEAMRREAALKRLTHAQKAALAAPALAAWEYLAQRPACVDMQEALRWGKAGVVAAEKSGVLLRVQGGGLLLAAGTQAAAARLLHRAGPPAPGAMLGVHGRAAALAAAEMMGQPLPPACTQAVYWGAQPPPWQAKGVRFAALGPEWAEVICAHNALLSRDEMAARLAAGGFHRGLSAGPAGPAAGGVHWPAPRWKHGHAGGFAAVPPHGAGRRAGGARHCAAAAAGARAVLLYLCRQPRLACFAEKAGPLPSARSVLAGRGVMPVPWGRLAGRQKRWYTFTKGERCKGAAAQFAAGWPASRGAAPLPQRKMAAAPG